VGGPKQQPVQAKKILAKKDIQHAVLKVDLNNVPAGLIDEVT
jgi:hypothetical protein